MTINIKVDDADTNVLTGGQVFEPVDMLTDVVILPSSGTSLGLDLQGQRILAPTRYH